MISNSSDLNALQQNFETMNANSITAETSNFFVAASASCTMLLLAVYYVFNVSQIPKIYTSNQPLRDFLYTHVHSLHEKYWPNVFYWEGRLQSILGISQRLPSSIKLKYNRREILLLSDGGEIGLDFMEAVPSLKKGEERLVVLLFPGLTSSSQTSYIKTLVMAITSVGAMVVVVNNRGLGGVKIKTPKLFCATSIQDVREVITFMRKLYPTERFLGIGTSLGGMLLSKYIIEYPKEAKDNLETAMVISTCWDAVNGILNLEKPFINKYVVTVGVLHNLQYLTNMYRDMLESRHCNFNKIMECRTIREFDNVFTAPHFGYESAMAYYKDSQLIPNVHKFPIPVVGLNAIDDPFAPEADLPIKEAMREGSNLAMIITERGGHLGWLEGTSPFKKPFHFMERIVMEYVKGVRLHGNDLKMNY